MRESEEVTETMRGGAKGEPGKVSIRRLPSDMVKYRLGWPLRIDYLSLPSQSLQYHVR